MTGAVSVSRFMFLGTSSAMPRPGKRNVSAMLLQFSCGSLTLVDCGEATQHQLMRSTVRFGGIDNILLTHLHGDHCFGIFGLLHTLNSGGREAPLNIYGPVGVEELVNTVFRLTGGWDGFKIRITELEPEKTHAFDLVSSADKTLAHVWACPMVHRIPAFGYVFRELEQPLVLDGEKAKALGVSGRDLGSLKEGKDVRLGDGTVVLSAEVTRQGKPARTVGIMQDTADASAALPYLEGCDLLVHEATFEHSRHAQALLYGHSTSVMAAELANKAKAKKLVLTHFSSRYSEDATILRDEATAHLDGGIECFLAEDFMSFTGPEFSPIGPEFSQDK